MEPEQPAPNRNQNWQRALNPQLTGRLLRPLVQPGVISPNLSRNILSRMQRTGAHMPLLDKALGYMRSIDDPQATRVPIVYARPVRPAEAADHMGETAAVPNVRPIVHPAVVQRAVAGVSGSEDLPASATARLGGVADPAPRAAPATELPDASIPPERGGMPVFVPAPGAGGRDLPAVGLPTVIARSVVPGAGGHDLPAVGLPTVIARSVMPGGRDLPPAESPAGVVPSSPRVAGPAPLNDLIASAGESPAPQRFVLPAGRRLQRAVDIAAAGTDAPRIATPGVPAELAVPPLVQARLRAADAAPPLLVAPVAASATGSSVPEITLPAPGAATAQAINRAVALPGGGLAQPPARPVVAAAPGSIVVPIQRRSAVAGAPPAPPGIVAPVMPIQSPQRPVVQPAEYGATARPVVAALPGAQRDAPPTPSVIGRPDRPAQRGPAMPISSAAPMIARALDRSSTGALASSDTAPAADAAPPSAGSAPATPDIDDVVDRALRKLMRYIDIEGERRGRKPWA